MADVLKNVTNVHDESPVANWISQINAGGTIYDIATHHGITFKNGSTDTNGVTWNGITELEVIIPTIADIVTSPVEFVGTVSANETISWASGFGDTAKKGNLVFITSDCTFAGKACEAGDMAVYDGSNWVVISGENQVTLVGAGEDGNAAITLDATAKEVLNVEGKKLSLKVDFTAIKDVLEATVSKNEEIGLEVTDGTVTVESKYIKLTKAEDTTSTIGTTKEIDLPTSLASGDVTISDKVFAKGDFDLTDASFPTVSKNASAISVSASTSIAINKTNGSDFVASIDNAVASVSVKNATYGSADFDMVSAYETVDGKSFVNGIHAATEEEASKAGDLVIPGAPSITGTKTFATGFGDASNDSGDVLASVTVGAISVSTSGSDLVRGLGESATGSDKDVITSVTIGSAVKSTGNWFVSGLGSEVNSAWDVVTSVSVGEVDLVADTTGGADAFINATVSDHVLSFGTSKFQTPVKVSQADTVVKGKTFTTGAVSLSGFAVSSADLLTGSIAQADTTFTYKSLATSSFELSFAADTKYIFDKAAETSYSFTTVGKSLDVTDAVISNAKYELINTGITASIAANSVVVGLNNDGVFPKLSISDPSRTISGTVGTDLSISKESWIALSIADLNVAGAYTLAVGASTDEGAIAVAAPDIYDVDGAIVTITENTFVTDVDVEVSGSSVVKKV